MRMMMMMMMMLLLLLLLLMMMMMMMAMMMITGFTIRGLATSLMTMLPRGSDAVSILMD